MLKNIIAFLRKIICGADPADAPILGCYYDEISKTTSSSERGIPDRKCFIKSADYYADMYLKATALLDASPPPTKPDRDLIYSCMVHSEWGLIFSGSAAIPHALALLQSTIPEAREAGAAILGEIGRNSDVVNVLTTALDVELKKIAGGERYEPLDSIIMALGSLRSKLGVPLLARLLRDKNADGDSRDMAVESLGKIVRRNFHKYSDPVTEAIAWLDKHPEIEHLDRHSL